MQKCFLFIAVILSVAFIFSTGCITNPINEELLTYEYQIDILESVKSISLQWVSGHVVIKNADDDTLKISQKYGDDFSETELFHHSIKDGALIITDPRTKRLFSDLSDTILTLSLPVAVYERLDVVAASADFNMSGVTSEINDAFINTVSGDIVADPVANKLHVVTTSGNISIDSTMTSELIIDTTSGEIFAACEQTSLENINVSSISGNITMDVEADTNSLTAATTSGEIMLNCISKISDISAVTVSGDIEMNAYEAWDVSNISTTSGDVAINWNEDFGFVLDYDSVSGELYNEFSLNSPPETYKDGDASINVNTVSGSLYIKPLDT